MVGGHRIVDQPCSLQVGEHPSAVISIWPNRTSHVTLHNEPGDGGLHEASLHLEFPVTIVGFIERGDAFESVLGLDGEEMGRRHGESEVEGRKGSDWSVQQTKNATDNRCYSLQQHNGDAKALNPQAEKL